MTEQPHAHPAGGHRAAGHGGHSWMMIACCIPMIVIAIALVATGVASPGFLLVAIMCTAMMALMMLGVGHDGAAPTDDTDLSNHGRSDGER